MHMLLEKSVAKSNLLDNCTGTEECVLDKNGRSPPFPKGTKGFAGLII